MHAPGPGVAEPEHASTPASRLAWGLVWLVLALVWIGSAGYRGLAGTDEGRYAEIAREMWASGDFVTPRLNGFIYFEKPPLQYWANALSIGILGPTELAVRLYTALCGIGCVALAALTGRRLWGRKAGMAAGFATAAQFWILALAQVLTLDMGLAFWLFAGVCAYLLSRADPVVRLRPRWMLLTWAALALAMLSKGLIALVLPGGAMVLYTLVERSNAAFRNLRWGPGLLVFLAIAAPWFVLAAARNPGFLEFFFVHEHFQRFATDEAHRPGKWWYFLPYLALGALPLATLLVPAARVGFTRPREKGEFGVERFLWLWALFIVVFFSFSRSKLPAYILPVFPALGLLLGRATADISPRVLAKHLAGFGLLALLVAVVGGADLWNMSHGTASWLRIQTSERTPLSVVLAAGPWLAAALATWGTLLLLAAGLAWNTRKRAALAAAALAGTLMLPYALVGYQRIARVTSAERAARALKAAVPATAPLYSVGFYEQGATFYLGRPVRLVAYSDEMAFGQAREPQRWQPTLAGFAAEWRAAPVAGALVPPDTVARLRALGVEFREIYADPRRVAIVTPGTPVTPTLLEP